MKFSFSFLLSSFSSFLTFCHLLLFAAWFPISRTVRCQAEKKDLSVETLIKFCTSCPLSASYLWSPHTGTTIEGSNFSRIEPLFWLFCSFFFISFVFCPIWFGSSPFFSFSSFVLSKLVWPLLSFFLSLSFLFLDKSKLVCFFPFLLFLLSSYVWSGRPWGAGGGSRGSLTQRLCAAPSRSLASDNWAVSCPQDATLLEHRFSLRLCLLSVVSWLVISVMSPCELDGIWPLCARQACCAWGNVQLGPKWPRECQTQPLERATRSDRAFFRCGWSELRRGFQQCDKWGEAGQGGQQPTMWGGQPAILLRNLRGVKSEKTLTL